MRYRDIQPDITFTPPEKLDAVHHLQLSPGHIEGASLHEYRQDLAATLVTEPTPPADVFMSVLHLRDFPATRSWTNGREFKVAEEKAGGVRLYDLRDCHASELRARFNTVHLFLPHAAFANPKGPRMGSPTWSSKAHLPHRDDVLCHLIQALLPTLRDPVGRDQLFCDHILQAALLHVGRTYGRFDLAEGGPRSSLSPREERWAKEMLVSRISGDLTTQEIAKFLGLSPDHFARMFKRTTGHPPYRWLSLQRIERAKSLLRCSGDSLIEIALACGFADQSHFTRSFSREVGLSPGEWRRQARS